MEKNIVGRLLLTQLYSANDRNIFTIVKENVPNINDLIDLNMDILY